MGVARGPFELAYLFRYVILRTVTLGYFGVRVRGRIADGDVAGPVELPATRIAGIILQIRCRLFKVLQQGVCKKKKKTDTPPLVERCQKGNSQFLKVPNCLLAMATR